MIEMMMMIMIIAMRMIVDMKQMMNAILKTNLEDEIANNDE